MARTPWKLSRLVGYAVAVLVAVAAGAAVRMSVIQRPAHEADELNRLIDTYCNAIRDVQLGRDEVRATSVIVTCGSQLAELSHRTGQMGYHAKQTEERFTRWFLEDSEKSMTPGSSDVSEPPAQHVSWFDGDWFKEWRAAQDRANRWGNIVTLAVLVLGVGAVQARLSTVEFEGRTQIMQPLQESEWFARVAETPSLPAADAHGNFPAVDYARASIARDIVRERLSRGLSQRELARLAGLSVETLCRIETGKHTARLATIVKLDRALERAGKNRRPRKSE